MSKFVNLKQDDAERVLGALHAIRFPQQRGQDSFPIRNIGGKGMMRRDIACGLVAIRHSGTPTLNTSAKIRNPLENFERLLEFVNDRRVADTHK